MMIVQNNNQCPLGIKIFSWLLILSSLVHMAAMLNYQWYFGYYVYWPDWLLGIRYCFSWLQRILGITAAIGLWRGNEYYGRRLAMAIAGFTISTLYWKHHYPAFLRHCQSLDEQFPGVFQYIGYPEFSFVRFCLPALVVHWVLDIAFCGSLWYYLTRPSVKNYFVKSHGS